MSSPTRTGTSSVANASSDAAPLSAFRSVPRTGVIYVTAEATRHGYRPEDPCIPPFPVPIDYPPSPLGPFPEPVPVPDPSAPPYPLA